MGDAREAVRALAAAKSCVAPVVCRAPAYGGMLAHAGHGPDGASASSATSAWQSEQSCIHAAGRAAPQIAGYELSLPRRAPRQQGPNYQEVVGLLAVTRDGTAGHRAHAVASEPTTRHGQTTTEAGIHVGWRGDLYVVLGDEQLAGGWVVRLYFNPLVRLIWLGAIVMALGGLSLSDRRLRIGVPRRARRTVAQAAE